MIPSSRAAPIRVLLLGDPVAHSLSPQMQQAAFDALGIDWIYEACHVTVDELEPAIRALRGAEYRGANITVPHKESAVHYLDQVDHGAAAVGAINTIVNKAGKLVGYNTDGAGFQRALEELDFVMAPNRSAVVLGAGGAARAVVYALLEHGLRVTVVNRRSARAHALARRVQETMGASVRVLELSELDSLQLAVDRAALLVNATSVGVATGDQDPLPVRVEIPGTLTVYDLTYGATESALVRRARSAGAKAADGLTMLLYQGAAAFHLWTGRQAPIEVMRCALSQVRPF